MPKNSVARARRGRTGSTPRRRVPPSCDLKLQGEAFASLDADGAIELWLDDQKRLARLTTERVAFLVQLAADMIGGTRVTLCSTEELADEVVLTIRRSRLVPGISELVVEGIDRARRIVIEVGVLAMLVRERVARRAA